MKKIFISLITLFCFLNSNAQTVADAFGKLFGAKSQIEGIITFGTIVPDTSKAYKKYFPVIAQKYQTVELKYDTYRGTMGECILLSKKEKDMKACASTNQLDLTKEIADLQAAVYGMYYEYKGIKAPSENGLVEIKSGATDNLNIASAIVGALVDGGIKLWQAIKTQHDKDKQVIVDDFKSDKYKLQDILVLTKVNVPKPSTPDTTKKKIPASGQPVKTKADSTKKANDDKKKN